MKHNNMRDDDAKLSRKPVTIESVPDDGYKVRYEQAMNLLGTIFNPYVWDGSVSDKDLIARIEIQTERYEKLRDSE